MEPKPVFRRNGEIDTRPLPRTVCAGCDAPVEIIVTPDGPVMVNAAPFGQASQLHALIVTSPQGDMGNRVDLSSHVGDEPVWEPHLHNRGEEANPAAYTTEE